MKGMSRTTGYSITDESKDEYAHIKQSIHDILTTLIGTRLCRRSYGSLVPEFIDQPCNDLTKLQIMNSASTGIITFEPRLKVNQITINGLASEEGKWTIGISGSFISGTGEEVFNEEYTLGSADV